MTRKDYQLLAEHLKFMYGRVQAYPWNFQKDTFDQTVSAVADALTADNHRFDRDRFNDAVYGERDEHN